MARTLQPGVRRVLVLIDELEVGGSQRQLLLLGRDLRARGNEVVLAYFREEGAVLRPRMEECGFEVRLVRKERRLDPRFITALARLLWRERGSAVITVGYTANLWTRLAGILVGAPRPVCCVGDLDYIPAVPGARLLAVLERLLAWRTRWIVPNSPVTARLLAGRRVIPPGKLQVIPNAIEIGSFLPRAAARQTLEALLGRPVPRPLVGALARLTPVKDLSTFLRAARKVRETMPGALFLVGGEGPERARLEGLRRELGLDDAFLLPGTLPGEEVVAAFDAAVLASVSEGLPNFLVEAMAMGVPVVSTAVGAVPEVLEGGRLGRLVRPGDAEGLARAILDVFRSPIETARRVEDGARKVRSWTTARMTDRFLALLDGSRA